MIGYSLTLDALEDSIEAQKPGWLKRARDRTAGFMKAGRYSESSTIWGEVKEVYMRLQYAKCVYCERKLEADPPGKAQHDVEHFRPKSSVRAWPVPASLKYLDMPFTAPEQGRQTSGYHLLAYQPLNYATSCKTCNSHIKKNYFPIAGPRDSGGVDPRRLGGEKAYLIYPIGTFDDDSESFDDPESLIEFHGVSPQAVHGSGHNRNRALVTIEFFQLDTGKRQKTLFRERAKVITSLYSFLQLRDVAGEDAERQIYQGLVEVWIDARSRHTSCARCFKALYDSDPVEAERVFKRAAAFLDSVS